MSIATDSGHDQAGLALRCELQRKDFSLNVDLVIPTSGITGIFGESGSGKTTLLRCIAGLEAAASGRLVVDGEVWHDAATGISLSVQARQIGYVFQEPRLFPHLNVRRNLEYGRDRTTVADKRVDFGQIVELLGLRHLLHRAPTELSGGEAQRVAIGRALLRAPRIVFMDEPLAGLERARKDEILPFLDRLQLELSVPIVYVSHSIDEVCRLCDYLVVMQSGRVLATGDLQSMLVRMDLPILNGEEAGAVIQGSVSAYDSDYDLTQLDFSGGKLQIPGRHQAPGSDLRIRVRANDVSLCRDKPEQSTILNIIPATIERIQPDRGPVALVRLRVGTDTLLARITRRSCDKLSLKEGDSVMAQIKAVSVRNSTEPAGS